MGSDVQVLVSFKMLIMMVGTFAGGALDLHRVFTRCFTFLLQLKRQLLQLHHALLIRC